MDVWVSGLARIIFKHPASLVSGELIQETTSELPCRAALQHYRPCLRNNWIPPCLFTFNLEAQASLSFITRWPLPSAARGYEVFVPVNLAAMCDSDWQRRGALGSGGRCKLQGSTVGSHLILLGKVSFPFLPLRSLQSVHLGLFGKEETCSDFSLLPSPELHENRCTWAVSEGRGTVSKGFSL